MAQTVPFPDLSRLAEVFRRYPEIEAVYLFGSAAEGRLHAESDLDLAVLPRRGAPRPNPLDLLADLARHGFCRVDLIFLDTEDILLKFEAVRRNRLLYAAEGLRSGRVLLPRRASVSGFRTLPSDSPGGLPTEGSPWSGSRSCNAASINWRISCHPAPPAALFLRRVRR
jgi:predicted nucleotidyltransferase